MLLLRVLIEHHPLSLAQSDPSLQYRDTFTLVSTMYNTFNLTFGLELEYLFRFDPKDYDLAVSMFTWEPRITTRARYEKVLRMHIIAALKSIGLPTCEVDERASTQKWVVTSEDALSANLEANRAAIEIRSPAYSLCPAALAQVVEAIEVLTLNFAISVNDKCGLHIHVGNRRKGYPLQTLKNFCMLSTVFEPQFNSLHSPDRISGPGATFAKGPTQAFEGISPWDTALIIQSTTSHKQLIGRYAPEGQSRDRYQAINLVPLVQWPFSYTIEFRQYQATTNPSTICNWIGICCGLVEKVHTMPFQNIASLIQNLAFDPRLPSESVLDLLKRLQMHDAYSYYRDHARYDHVRPQHAWVDSMIEDGVELSAPNVQVESIDGESIIKTISRKAAIALGYADAASGSRPRTVFWGSPGSCALVSPRDDSFRGIDKLRPMPEQVASERALTAEQQRIRNIIKQSPGTTWRQIIVTEREARSGEPRTSSSNSSATLWSVD